MTRYIDADAIEMPLFESDVDETWVRVAIDATPTADVQPIRHGKWVKAESMQYFRKHYPAYTCSACGFRKDGKWNYCPNCGARMDK